MIAALRERLVGQDPFQPERLRWMAYHPTESAFYEDLTQGFAAIEFACLDIQGKATGRPVHDLLGGAVRDKIEFAGYLFFRYGTDDAAEVATAEQLVEHARDLVDRLGFRSLKLKAGVFRPEHEVEAMRALREAFPDHPMRFDPNSNWSVETAIHNARAFEEIDLQYYEDPCWGMPGMARLRQRTWLPLATNTVVTKIDHIPEAVAMEAVDVVLMDPALLRRHPRQRHGSGDLRGVRVGRRDALERRVRRVAGGDAARRGGDAAAGLLRRRPLPPHDRRRDHRREAASTATERSPCRPVLASASSSTPIAVARYHELYRKLGTYVFTGDERRPGWVPMIPEADWPAD